MSDLGEKRPLDSNALEIDAIASDWVERRDFGPWSQTDQQALDAWIQEALAHRIAFVRIEAGWSRTGRLAVLQPPLHQASAQSSEPGNWLKLFRIASAAAAVVTVVVGGVAFYGSKPAGSAYATNIGERETLSLADGSQIELNTDTVLRTAVSANKRIVWLDHGEAYFHVKHDPAHPFVVIAGAEKVTDLGTEFSVRRDTDRLKVAVVEGVVQLDTTRRLHNEPEQRVLRKGDVVVATASAITLTRSSPHELTDELGWRHGVLIFDRTPLSEAAAEINRYNRKKLVIADPVAARMKIGGTFPKNNINAITVAARELFGLHVEDRGDEIVISRQ